MCHKEGPNDKFPNLLIIGAMKAGTTSLHSYLSKHPDIFMSSEKELNFFCKSLNFNRGVRWYKKQFNSSYKIRGESSPNYTKWESTPKLIHRILGSDIKLIYIVRNPISRFLSQCNHQQIDPNIIIQSNGFDKDELFTNGLYNTRLKFYRPYFNLDENLLIITQENLIEDKEKVMNKVLSFLGLNLHIYPIHEIDYKLNITSEKIIASKVSKFLAQEKYFKYFKKIMSELSFFERTKFFYHKWAYKQRTAFNLTNDNRLLLNDMYYEDMKQFKKNFNINYINDK